MKKLAHACFHEKSLMDINLVDSLIELLNV